MGSITINGKNIKSISIGGKNINSLNIAGKLLSLVKELKNTYTGTMKPELIPKFESYKTEIPARAFYYEGKISGVVLPEVTSIGEHAFHWSDLTNIEAPKATTIGGNAFYHVVNAATTTVTIPKKFDSDGEKNRIFGSGHWNNVTFKWTDPWHYGGGGDKPHPTKNDWKGTFSTNEKQTEFENIITKVNSRQFNYENKISGISLPNAITIGSQGFYRSPLTYINVPKATTIDSFAFGSIINATTTQVTMNHKFNTNVQKSNIFNYTPTNLVTFHWTNDDGTPA